MFWFRGSWGKIGKLRERIKVDRVRRDPDFMIKNGPFQSQSRTRERQGVSQMNKMQEEFINHHLELTLKNKQEVRVTRPATESPKPPERQHSTDSEQEAGPTMQTGTE